VESLGTLVRTTPECNQLSAPSDHRNMVIKRYTNSRLLAVCTELPKNILEGESLMYSSHENYHHLCNAWTTSWNLELGTTKRLTCHLKCWLGNSDFVSRPTSFFVLRFVIIHGNERLANQAKVTQMFWVIIEVVFATLQIYQQLEVRHTLGMRLVLQLLLY